MKNGVTIGVRAGLVGEYNQIGESGEVLLLHGRKIIKKSGEYLKKDLVNNPELALDQKNATKIMIYGMETGMFTTKKISSYISEDSADYLNARRVINGMDKADSIAGYASKLEECLRWL
ncbi:hypothetical protein [uncultured Haemophilus sp.]|uniref:hypothetical protein n=1 Tax=uncultured Haemophilus sp. TaxID=237779 RepID=UPI0025E30B02|nr:hypothetical protein [uncultured Haemophilus sp.]